MVTRLFGVAVFLLGMLAAGQSWAEARLRPAVDRPDIIEVGDPFIVGRDILRREMKRNIALDEYIDLYGWPDYAEVQEIQAHDPWAAYEMRLYYIQRDQYLVFGRVHVAPSVFNFGVKKFEGPINPEALNRLLTAQPAAATLPETALPGPEVEAEVEAPAPAAAAPAAPAAAEEAATTATTEEAVPAAAPAEAPLEAQAEAEAPVEAPVAAEAGVEPTPAVVASAPKDHLEAIVQRLEAAADRAYNAAEEAEQASNAAAQSADRATSSLDRIIQTQGQP
jgi:hypothetical protein